MRLIRVGLANVNTTVGAFASNGASVMERAHQLAIAGCTVASFQEQVFSGYPAEDLVQWKQFVVGQGEELRAFAFAMREFSTVFTLGVTVEHDGHLYNSAAVVYRGEILGIVPKEKLPTYNVFYDDRTFSRGQPGLIGQVRLGEAGYVVPFGDLIFEFPFGVLGVEICEDIWSPDGPMRRRAYSGAELIINHSASPFRAGVLETRREMISTRASDNESTVVYVNQVGANDALVFDGGGFVNQNGRMLFEAPRFQSGGGVWTQVVDLDRTSRRRHENTTWRMDALAFRRSQPLVQRLVCEGPSALKDAVYPTPESKNFFMPAAGTTTVSVRNAGFDDIIKAELLALSDYIDKTGAFKRIGIALSGGKDSGLTTAFAWLYARRRFMHLEGEAKRAAIRDFVHVISMPTRFNSDGTKNLARAIAEALGLTFREVPIQEAFERECDATRLMLGLPADGVLARTTRQNIQARLRGMRMWNWANEAQALWLQTSNMSEKAVGYTTIGGDMMGGYSLIANLPKTEVTELLLYIAEKFGIPVMHQQAQMVASAELEDDQSDEKDLMPFPVLDACLHLFAGEKMMPAEFYPILLSMWTEAELVAMDPRYQPGKMKVWVKRFMTLFLRSIYKWVQTPQSVHLGSLDLDRERALQIPVVQSLEWVDMDAFDELP